MSSLRPDYNSSARRQEINPKWWIFKNVVVDLKYYLAIHMDRLRKPTNAPVGMEGILTETETDNTSPIQAEECRQVNVQRTAVCKNSWYVHTTNT
jgi:hypothetical protein